MANEETFFNEGNEKETDIAKCPACGSNMVFSPVDSCLKCDHCGTKVALSKDDKSEEQNFEKLMAPSDTWGDETHVFRCDNCGAKEVLSKKEIAKECPFCGTTNVVEVKELSGIRPNAVVPFAITKDNASEKVISWTRKRIFAPRAYKKSASPEAIKGTYNPAFTFDTNTVTPYFGRLGKYYTRTRRVNGKTVTERYLKYFNISGTFTRFFDDILVQASDTINQKSIEKMCPFETNDSKDYSSEFLQGFSANHYSKDGMACWKQAQDYIRKNVKAAILAKYSYDVIDSFNYDITCHNITYKYVLLPIYVGHCNWKTKLYNFFVNGRSGKVTGKTPISPLRVLIAVLLGLAVVAAIGVVAYFALQ